MDDGSAGGDKKKVNPSSDAVEYLLENDVIDIDTLKQFTIPKRKSHKQDVISRVEMTSLEMGELVRLVKQACRHRDSIDTFVFSRPRMVHSAPLLTKFMNKKKRMRADGYAEKELQETFVFLYYEEDYKASNACRDGISIKNSSLFCLGDPEMGVYVSKYSDVISAKALKNKTSGTLMILKLIKGRVKLMMDKSTVALDPSPNFDCHLLKPPNNLDYLSHTELYEATQLYVYEYMEDSDLADKPSQLLPYALLTFKHDKLPRTLAPVESISSKFSKKSVKRKPDKSNELLHKKHKQLIRDTILSGQQSIESPHQQPPHYNHHPLVPPKEQQLWTGGFRVGDVPLGTVILQSSCPLIDASLLKWELRVEQQVTVSTLREVVLEGVGRLDLRRETSGVDGLCLSSGILHPSSRASQQFTAYMEHLLNNKMVGYTSLADHLEVLITPNFFIRDYGLVNSDDAHKPMLCCIFVCRESINIMIKDHLKNCVQLESALSSGKAEPADLCTFTDAPASPEPEPEQPALNIRDPRIRFKTKSTKLNAIDNVVSKQASVEKSIIGSSRLMTVFENMANLQNVSNAEVFSKPYGIKMDEDSEKIQTNLLVGIDKKDIGRSIFGLSMPANQKRLNKNDPRVGKANVTPTTKINIEQSQPQQLVSSIDSEAPKTETSVVEKEQKAEPETQKSKFVLPEIVYATAIADPKVRQLLEDLKNKNIIGFGNKTQGETSSNEEAAEKFEDKSEKEAETKSEVELAKEDIPPSVVLSSNIPENDFEPISQNPDPLPVQVPIKPPAFASPAQMEDFPKDDDNSQEDSHFHNYNNGPDYNNDYNMNTPNFPHGQGSPCFRGDFNAFTGRGRPFRPFHLRNRLMGPRDAPDPRRRFPSFLPDPKSFQKSYMESHQQPPQDQPLPAQQKPDHQTKHQPPPHHQQSPNQQPPPHRQQQPHQQPPPHHQQQTHLQSPSHYQQKPHQQTPSHLQQQPHQQPLHQQPPPHYQQQPPSHHQQPTPHLQQQQHHQQQPHQQPPQHQQPPPNHQQQQPPHQQPPLQQPLPNHQQQPPPHHQLQTHHQPKEQQSPHHKPPYHQPQRLPPPHHQPPHRHQPPRHHQPPQHTLPPHHHQQPYQQQSPQQQQHYQHQANQQNQQPTWFQPTTKLDPRIKRSRFSDSAPNNFAGNSSTGNSSENHKQNNSHNDYNRYNKT